MSDLSVVEPAAHDRAALGALAAAVISARPAYAPAVAAGHESAAEWFFAKPTSWSRVARTEGVIVGHVGVKHGTRLPDGSRPARGDAELCRLMVDPRRQRTGIASLLVDAAVTAYPNRMWATVAAEGASHRLLAARGWLPSHRVWFPKEQAFGLVVVSPAPAS